LARWLRGQYSIPGDPIDPEQPPAEESSGDAANGSGRKH
jgi:hypothetical protein